MAALRTFFLQASVLLRLFMHGMLLAEAAILAHLDPLRVIFLVFHGVVISLFAFLACKGYLYAHFHYLQILYACKIT